MSLWKNESARVPLAVIGVLFVMISAVISINISRLDAQMAAAMVPGDEMDGADTALLYATADLARIINYAGMEALKQMGETPVIEPDNTSQYGHGATTPTVAEFNRNWAKGMIADTMNQYIRSNYMFNSYTYRGYAINTEPLNGWQDIKITPVHMALDRDLSTYVLPPANTYQTYWKVTVPMNISIVDLESGDVIDTQHIAIDNLITSRYPLLEGLTLEYEQRLNGADAVMAETTAFANAFTWTRGYMQYYTRTKGTENIVTNEHLALVVNGALLLDQGFVFNSVDTGSIIEYAMQTRSTLTGKDEMDAAEFLQTLDVSNGSFKVDPDADAATSTGDVKNATRALEAARSFDYNVTPVTDLLNNDSLPGGSEVKALIQKTIPQVYDTRLATGINRSKRITPGNHTGFETDHHIYDWGEPDTMILISQVPGDNDVPGNLYGETWGVTWTRKHVWRHYYTVYYRCKKIREYECEGPDGNVTTCTEEYWTTCSRIEYNETTTVDTREDTVTITIRSKENSRTSINLDHAGTTLSTMNDIDRAYASRDVEYEGSYVDAGLEEAYDRYKVEVYEPSKMTYIKDRGLSGEMNIQAYAVTFPDWLADEAQLAVDEITAQIREDIHLDPDINYLTYPNPADAMRAAARDLTAKIEAKRNDYEDAGRYGTNGKYSSCSAKVIAQVRRWYVDQVLYEVNENYMDAAEQIDDQIDTDFSESADDVREANNKGAELLKGALSFPIGLTMRAEHVRPDGSEYAEDDIAYWDEEVTLGVDMEPDYLFMDSDGGKKLINLGVQNVCIFGPTGIPVLPPPNYVVQFNSWMINVEGRINGFTLLDVDNKVHPNPMFGHEAQVYTREEYTIIDFNGIEIIGENKPIEFQFSTGTFIAVPPSGKPIGDRLGGYTETSPDYGKILRK